MTLFALLVAFPLWCDCLSIHFPERVLVPFLYPSISLYGSLYTLLCVFPFPYLSIPFFGIEGIGFFLCFLGVSLYGVG